MAAMDEEKEGKQEQKAIVADVCFFWLSVADVAACGLFDCCCCVGSCQKRVWCNGSHG